MACASRYVGNGVSHFGLRGVGHGVWVTICGYVTVRYGALRLCVTVRYGALRVRDGELCQSMLGLRFHMTIGKKTLEPTHFSFLSCALYDASCFVS